MTTNTDVSDYIIVSDWNERTAKMCGSNNWRASLVPAAAVIPAPRVYTKAVAVKKLVVNFKTAENKNNLLFLFSRHKSQCDLFI